MSCSVGIFVFENVEVLDFAVLMKCSQPPREYTADFTRRRCHPSMFLHLAGPTIQFALARASASIRIIGSRVILPLMFLLFPAGS